MSNLLHGINTLIESTGNLPVNSPDVRHPGVIRAKSVLTRFNRSVQSRGFWFNRESWTLTPLQDGTIPVPPDVLICDAVYSGYNLVMRGNKLYDLDNHTFIFESTASIDVEFTHLIDIEDLPFPVWNHIVARAKHEFLVEQHGDADKIKHAAKQVETTEWILKKAELDITDANVFGTSSAAVLLGRLRGLKTVGYNLDAIGRRNTHG